MIVKKLNEFDVDANFVAIACIAIARYIACPIAAQALEARAGFPHSCNQVDTHENQRR